MNDFDYYSLRAKYARLGHTLKSPIFQLFLFFGFSTSLVAGLILLFSKNSSGWLVLIITICFSVTFIIYKMLFLKVPLGKTENITDILSSNAISIMDLALFQNC